jgi:hypothetical protein
VRLGDGEVIPCSMASSRSPTPRSPLAEVLGCEVDEDGSLVVDEHGETTVPRGVRRR